MPTQVKIAINARHLTGGQAVIEAEGQTVAEALADLSAKYPLLGEMLFAPDGTPRRFLNFYVNGEDIRFRQGLATPLAPGDQLLLLSAVGGG